VLVEQDAAGFVERDRVRSGTRRFAFAPWVVEEVAAAISQDGEPSVLVVEDTVSPRGC
jgi:hypothetical protein